MIPAFNINELKFLEDTEDDNLRTRKIFEILKRKAINNDYLSEHEKNFFCSCVKHSNLTDGKIEDYKCCENYIFTGLYLIYVHDLTGGSIYHKPINGKLEKVLPNEVKNDIKILIDIADRWNEVIAKTNHTDPLLQSLSTEVRNELKQLEQLPEFLNDPFSKRTFSYIYKRRTIILHAKFTHCIALEIFEEIDPNDLVVSLNNTEIEFNEYSLIHIVQRHYSEITKQYSTGKSFHNENFKPRIIGKQLKEIIEKIDKSKLYENDSIKKIAFCFKNMDYVIWTSRRTKSIKGRGNVIFNRIETFYPITNLAEKNKLKNEYSCVILCEDLSIYLKRNIAKH